ncbi:MAG: hypothetical protein AB1806_12085 [Acidobacteriota bacterium]
MNGSRPSMPRYGWLGLAVMAGSEIGMLAALEPFWSWHTPIAWSGYILFVDALVKTRSGSSWLSDARAEFAFMAAVSFPLWLVFEGYNLLIRNWYYINLPENPVLRNIGYAWSFATIWPAIFLTAELVGTIRRRQPEAAAPGTVTRWPRGTSWSVAAGALMLVWPILWPAPYLAAPVFLGFIFLLDPINARLGLESLAGDLRQRRFDRAGNLLASGFVCGLLWECWNYWARTKWIYTVPILPEVKVFEMPVLGFLGFPAFALECLTMYVLARRLLWRGSGRGVGIPVPASALEP